MTLEERIREAVWAAIDSEILLATFVVGVDRTKVRDVARKAADIGSQAAVRALQGRKLRDEAWDDMARDCVRPYSAHRHCHIRDCRPDRCPRLKARE